MHPRILKSSFSYTSWRTQFQIFLYSSNNFPTIIFMSLYSCAINTWTLANKSVYMIPPSPVCTHNSEHFLFQFITAMCSIFWMMTSEHCLLQFITAMCSIFWMMTSEHFLLQFITAMCSIFWMITSEHFLFQFITAMCSIFWTMTSEHFLFQFITAMCSIFWMMLAVYFNPNEDLSLLSFLLLLTFLFLF